ncbi:MAG: 2,4-dihydroxyhept-2-ene,7-dioic acid aldolase [Hyphomicrobiales bacterium]|nr:2,4-dihydroxyhept-2-ene,7-dioic acid aldolase [Hyphomicrobiales bacterium]
MSNPLRAAISQGRCVMAVNLGGMALPAVDMIARAGADCLFVDCERTPVGIESVPALSRAARANGMSCVVRSESAEPGFLLRYLDCGIDGLIVPSVESAATCDRMVAVARQFGKGDVARTFLIAQIESVQGRAKLTEIAGHPGVDLVLIGPNDLAHSMGFDGDIAKPELQAAVRSIATAVSALHKPFGLPGTMQNAAEWKKRGARFFVTTLEQFIAPTMREMRSILS